MVEGEKGEDTVYGTGRRSVRSSNSRAPLMYPYIHTYGQKSERTQEGGLDGMSIMNEIVDRMKGLILAWI